MKIHHFQLKEPYSSTFCTLCNILCIWNNEEPVSLHLHLGLLSSFFMHLLFARVNVAYLNFVDIYLYIVFALKTHFTLDQPPGIAGLLLLNPPDMLIHNRWIKSKPLMLKLMM